MKTLKLFLLGLVVLCGVLLINSQVFAATVIPDPSSSQTAGEQLKKALEEGKSVILNQNITDLPSTVEISDAVTIDGNGKTIEVSTFKKIFNLVDGADVTFENVTIKNTFADGRCIDIRAGGVKLNLIGSNIITTTTAGIQNPSHDRGINIGGSFTTPAEILIKNSNITTGKAGYAIMVYNPINLKIDNSDITGYTTLYLKGPDSSAGSAGSVINIVNGSVLNGKNDYADASSTFNVIAFEDNNITVNVEDSTLKATGTENSKQYIFEGNEALTGNKITVKGTSEIIVKDGFSATQPTEDNKVLDVAIGVTSNAQIPKEYLPSDVEIKDLGNGNFEVVVATHKVKIDDVEYTIENGKTVKDIAEYNDIIKKEGYTFKGFETVEGEEWLETKEIKEDIELKTVFEKIEEDKPTAEEDKKEDKPTVEEDKPTAEEDKKEDKPTVEEDKKEDKLVVKKDKKNEKDDVPRTGVESISLTVFAIIAVMSIIGLALTKK